MHREQLIVHSSGHKIIIRTGQLGANRQCFDAAHQEEQHGEGTVQYADFLVINRGQPISPTGFAVRANQTEVATLWSKVQLRSNGSVVCVVGHGKIVL